jgi:hypothetical protein
MRDPDDDMTGPEIIVVASRPAGEKREFALEPDSAPDIFPPLQELEHENELIERMTELGYRLTFVAGGSRPDESRRFYFRRA